MKIVFFGNFSIDYTTESHHLWTYKKLGHEVKTFQEPQAKADNILKEALTADMFVWTHTHGWNTPGMSNVLKELKDKNIPSVGYHLDLWKGIKREIDIDTDPYWNIEYFFTVDKLFVKDLKEKGIKAHYLPAGVVEKECYISGYDKKKYPHEVIFVGSKGYHEEWQYRPKLIQWLSDTYRDQFGHYGGDGLGVVRGTELNKLYASCKVVVGDTLCKGFNYPYYYSDRLFETTGRGGFIIFPYIEGIRDLFQRDELVTYPYNDFAKLKQKIDYYLENERSRKQIKLNGFLRTKTSHTYTNRLKELISIVKG